MVAPHDWRSGSACAVPSRRHLSWCLLGAGAAPSQSIIATRARHLAGVHNNTQAGVRSSGGRTKRTCGSGERTNEWSVATGAFARFFFFFFWLAAPNRARLTRGAAGPGARSRCDPVGGREAREGQSRARLASRVRSCGSRQSMWMGAVEAGQRQPLRRSIRRWVGGNVEWWLWLRWRPFPAPLEGRSGSRCLSKK